MQHSDNFHSPHRYLKDGFPCCINIYTHIYLYIPVGLAGLEQLDMTADSLYEALGHKLLYFLTVKL